jgi:uncharacterized coiled-coil protein SlyX
MTFLPIFDIRQFNEDARQSLDELHRQRASTASFEASHLPAGNPDRGGGLLLSQKPGQGANWNTANMHRTAVEQRLALAEVHIAKGEKIVARQRDIVDELQRDGHALAATASALLGKFEELQAIHIDDRDRLRRELSE